VFYHVNPENRLVSLQRLILSQIKQPGLANRTSPTAKKMLDINKITLSITLKFSENVISISAMVSAEHQAHICSRSKFTAHLIAVINL